MSCCPCCHATPRKPFGVFTWVFNVLFLYVLLVFGGGTLINTGHPIAVEVGQLLHLVTFVDPAIFWADSHGYEPLANAIRVLSDGISFA